jgi:oxygen-independent coproporphyrinogen-3 oxidase
VPKSDRAFEFFLNVLRLVDGFTEDEFEAATGLPIHSVAATLQLAQGRDLLARAGARWLPTSRGFRFLNNLQGLFLDACGSP